MLKVVKLRCWTPVTGQKTTDQRCGQQHRTPLFGFISITFYRLSALIQGIQQKYLINYSGITPIYIHSILFLEVQINLTIDKKFQENVKWKDPNKPIRDIAKILGVAKSTITYIPKKECTGYCRNTKSPKDNRRQLKCIITALFLNYPGPRSMIVLS